MSAEHIAPESPATLPVRSEPSPLGRPREYSPDDAQAVVDAMAEGRTLWQAAAECSIPVGTIRAWEARDPSFAASLLRARKLSAHGFASQTVDIADDPEIERSHEAIGRARLRIESRKWLASKYEPGVYGDKLDVSGDLQLTIVSKRYTPDVDAIDVTPAVDNSVDK